jgi:hypothetical protein
MALSGHRTTGTFLRYDITSDEDKRDALRAVQERSVAVSNVIRLCECRETTENRSAG